MFNGKNISVETSSMVSNTNWISSSVNSRFDMTRRLDCGQFISALSKYVASAIAKHRSMH